MSQSAFIAIVQDWVQLKHSGATVVSVTSRSEDWLGSTEEGFSAGFAVIIEAKSWHDGSRLHLEVEGSEMESLWRHVINSYPAGQEKTE